MNKRFGLGLLALLLIPLLAHATCDSAKADIDAKIKAKVTAGYTLDVLPAGQTTGAGKVVGHCEGGKQIVYTRDTTGTTGADDHHANPAMRMTPANAEPAQATSSSH